MFVPSHMAEKVVNALVAQDRQLTANEVVVSHSYEYAVLDAVANQVFNRRNNYLSQELMFDIEFSMLGQPVDLSRRNNLWFTEDELSVQLCGHSRCFTVHRTFINVQEVRGDQDVRSVVTQSDILEGRTRPHNRSTRPASRRGGVHTSHS
mmetsp:Transcript_20324/g.65492  ORF Transcript_20324/g.65492 Transcript_20324/m.65492 type:complete len:150 (-) Transcript_20324:266-715(-)